MIAKTIEVEDHCPIHQLAINTLRCLSVDMSFYANSGHPGAPMGLAPLVHVLFGKMNLSPKSDKKWINRDRFVLSNGHACALLYSALHLYGYDISLTDLKSFRQLGSKTPGHPEAFETPGIEVTTGPLGQGFANAVGLAIAQAHMAATYNRPDFELFNNKTFVILGDGCMMEGVASEAASLAGHLKLGNLIALYDDNHICIDGSTDATFTEDVTKRFEAYGWNVEHVKNGNTDLSAIHDAIDRTIVTNQKPTLIKVTTSIGYGSLLQDTAAAHGSPLKVDDIKQFRARFGIPEGAFTVPDSVYELYHNHAAKSAKTEAEWNKLFATYSQEYPDLHQQMSRRVNESLPSGWQDKLPTFKFEDVPQASRKMSEAVLNSLQDVLPELMSGSADLTPSNCTRWKAATDFQAPETQLGTYAGRYLRYGDKEHAMGAVMNGMASYGGNFIPMAGTFLNFVSYAAPAVRLAALSRLRVIWIATHDSIALGEDGPTHQPIETLAHFRAMPNINVWRPADGNETSAAYLQAILSQETPSIIALTRQNLPQLQNSSISLAAKGGYICHDFNAGDISKDIIFVSTGSEVGICLEAARTLNESYNLNGRVVSIPCHEIFDAQSQEYKLSVLPKGVPVLSVEAGSRQSWQKYSHEQFGIDCFGLSAPAQKVFEAFDMTPSGVVQRALMTIKFYEGRSQYLHSPLQKAFET